MAVVEIDVGGQLRKIETDDVSPEAIDEIAGHLNSSTTTTATSTPGWGASLGEAVTDQVLRPVADAASSIISSDTSLGQRALDAAALTAPLLAPEATALGVGAHTVARRGGLPQEDAETIGKIATGVGALTQGVASGVGAVRSFRAGRAAVRAAAEAAPGEAAANTARAVKAGEESTAAASAAGQAGQRVAATTTREALAGATPEGAGATVQAEYPAASAAGRTRVQNATYNPVAQYAEARGLGLDVATPEATALAGELENAEGKWGALLSGKEKTVVSDLMTSLRGSKEAAPTGVLNAAGQAVTRVTPPRKVTYADLDAAKLALSRVRGASSVRAAVDRALAKVVEGTPAAAKLKYGGSVWKGAVAPAEKLARKVAGAESPDKAFRLVVGSGKDASRMRMARNLMEPGQWNEVVGATVDDIFQRAGGDGVKAARLWGKYRPEAQAELDPTGRMGQLFEGLASLAQSEKGRLANVAEAGAENVAGVKAAGAANVAAARAAADATNGGRASGFARYLGHRAGYAAAGGLLAGGGTLHYRHGRGALSSALIGLATAGAIELAGPAAIALARGTVGSRGAAGALATAISAFGEENPDAKVHADAVSSALTGDGEVKAPASALPPPSSSTGPFSTEINAVGKVVGLDPKFLHAVIQRESGYKADAVSEAGAHGLMQVLPDTFERLRPQVEKLLGRAADLGYPLDNLVAGAILYRQHLDQTNGNVEEAARLYHGGTDLTQHGPRTQAYGRNVASTYSHLATVGR